MGKGRPFLEVFASALNEDYRFPILEVFAFVYALGTFVLAGFGAQVAKSGEAIAFNLVNSLATGLPMFIFLILVFKNIAFDLGNDLERGVIQTLLSYPLKRRLILTAKLLSALGVALLLFLGIQIFALFLLAPHVVSPYLTTVFLTYVAALGFPLLVSGLVLVLTLLLKRGGLALIVGVVLFIGLGILSSLVTALAVGMGSALPLKVYSVVNPSMALQRYIYTAYYTTGDLWAPDLSEVLLYIGGCYALVASVFIVGYIYFEKRLGI